MNKHLLTFAILCVSAIPAGAQLEPQPCTFQVKQIKAPQQIVSTRMPGSFDITVELETDDCSIPTAWDAPSAKPALIWMKPKKNFLAHAEVEFKQLELGPHLLSDLRAHTLEAEISVMTLPKLPAGDQSLDMALTYRAIDQSGNPVSGRFAFNVPLKVVAPSPSTFWEKHDKTKTILIRTGIAIAAIPLVPLFIILGILGVLPDC